MTRTDDRWEPPRLTVSRRSSAIRPPLDLGTDPLCPLATGGGAPSGWCGRRESAGGRGTAAPPTRPRRLVVHYLLFYDVVPDYAERRAPFRAEHLDLARRAQRRGDLVLGGALADPIDGAVLLFRGDSPAAAEAFALSDPYVKNGLVT